ncbi:hypothetical protein Pla52o_52780 [Novipirellula galeiformis]|uniref:Uncharacterized protein n=1 Tax=Novipirellula galeiformis TaxID=2528004 RepID=A0A5C6BZI9_9BACT|nr:hypothetical protein Pla52o_52780 [Novipirellula galeiformis]
MAARDLLAWSSAFHCVLSRNVARQSVSILFAYDTLDPHAAIKATLAEEIRTGAIPFHFSARLLRRHRLETRSIAEEVKAFFVVASTTNCVIHVRFVPTCCSTSTKPSGSTDYAESSATNKVREVPTKPSPSSISAHVLFTSAILRSSATPRFNPHPGTNPKEERQQPNGGGGGFAFVFSSHRFAPTQANQGLRSTDHSANLLFLMLALSIIP